MKGLPVALTRHLRFYGALIAGVLAWASAYKFGLDAAALAGGDIFYLVFLLLFALLLGQTPADLKRRAKREDEGIVVVVLITLATMAFFTTAVFVALNATRADALALALGALGVPLGWCVLHAVMASHYASLHYFDDPECKGNEGNLIFPGGGDPGIWDFLYFSFVIGMTAQVSDVQVTTMPMRRAVMLHGMLSFFFNTVFIAMAVNAAVGMAS
jgi:uncharacterized membrane protein